LSYSQLILPETPYGLWELSGNSPVDLTGRNNASYVGCVFGKKPIIYGLDASTVINENSSITISNIYKLFLTGSEQKEASIEFFFNIPDSDEEEIQILDIGTFSRCYVKSDRIYLEANNTVCSVLTDTWDKTNYVAIVYKRGSISISLNNLGKKSVALPESFSFPDPIAPDIKFGPAGNDIIVYLNAVAIYSYALSETQISSRIDFSKFGGNAERVATSINGEIINPRYQTDMEILSDKLSTKSMLESGTYSNVIIESDYLTLEKIPPVTVSSRNSEVNFNLDIDGISFGGESYIELQNISSKFIGIDNVITLSLFLDGLSTRQTIFEFGAGVDYISLSLIETDNDTVSVVKKNLFGDEEMLIESSDLGSDYTSYFNIAVIFEENQIELLVNDISQGTAQLSQPLSPLQFYLGNSFSGLYPLTSKIKNFTIDNFINDITNVISEMPYQDTYVDEYSNTIQVNSEEKIFLYGGVGLYTLSLQNTLNVSQRGTWQIQYPKISNSLGTIVTYNYASKNSIVTVNDQEILKSQFIPGINYENPESVKIEATLKTDNSESELPILNNVFLVAYNTMDIESSGGKYKLTSIPDEDNNPFNNIQPFLLSDIESNPLDRSQNMGAKFIRQISYLPDIEDNPDGAEQLDADQLITSGGRIIVNSELEEDEIKLFEFLIKFESIPSTSQEYTIFSVDRLSAESLSMNSAGLIKNGTYDLYIDGQIINSTMPTIDVNEFYYVAVVFPDTVSEDIYIGINNSLQNMLDGSISHIVINNVVPSSLSSYITYRYEAMLGRNKLSISDTDPISITDDYGTSKTYITSSDGSIFSMNELPKIRIIQNAWESLD
jgi:hypothetical protein